MDSAFKTAKMPAENRVERSLIEKVADRLASQRTANGKLSGRPIAAAPVAANAPFATPSAPTLRQAPRPEFAPANDLSRAMPRRPHIQRQITIDFDQLRSSGFLVPGEESMLAEEFRMIKRPLLQHAFAEPRDRGDNAHLIMVTSSQPQEGKTFMSINMALSMASEHDKSVLLIDADLAAPSVHAVLGFEATRGLADVLLSETIDLADVLIGTNVDNLTILPAGRSLPSANELFASARMASFVDQLARQDRDRIIIFDAPPMLARSEPSVLARHMGQIAFVVQAENTTQTAINEALAMLDGHEHIGLILNKVNAQYGSERFGHYYGKYSR